MDGTEHEIQNFQPIVYNYILGNVSSRFSMIFKSDFHIMTLLRHVGPSQIH